MNLGPMARLTRLPRPFIVAVITDREPAAAIAEMRAAALDGAHAFEINLPPLANATEDALRSVFCAVERPVYTSCRRADFMTVYGLPRDEMPDWDDETRINRQLDAIRLGARAIDMEMDTFDPRPAPPLGTSASIAAASEAGEPFELTDNPPALARQQEVIAQAHDLGAEVVLSCHTGRPQRTEGLVSIGTEAVNRGADLLKIVTPCRDTGDLLEVFKASAALSGEIPIPFTLIGAGPAGQLSRSIGVNFGSSWAIGQRQFTPGGFHPQPLVAHLRETMRLIPWRVEAANECA